MLNLNGFPRHILCTSPMYGSETNRNEIDPSSPCSNKVKEDVSVNGVMVDEKDMWIIRGYRKQEKGWICAGEEKINKNKSETNKKKR